MKIIKKTLVKQIITEKSKNKIKKNFEDQKMRLEQECQQLLFEKRKLKSKPGISKREVEHRFQEQIDKRIDDIKLIELKEEQLELLEIGSEIVESEVETLVEVSVGMDFESLIRDQAIVIKDDIVVRLDK
ncbi:YlqD family protein [Oceanobacillus sp. CAU 1775]